MEIDRKIRSSPAIAENTADGNMSPPQVELVSMGALATAGRAKKMIVEIR